MSVTVAVTGGIGAGKSTVAGLLAARGAVVVDSDRLARDVVAVATPGLAAVARQFGDGVLAADGSLDRAALASIVFTDAGARRQLEAITHPLVRARFAELEALAPAGSVVVNDIPLLTTTAAAAAFHLVIGVGAPVEVRVGRLVERGLTAADARARIASQIGDDVRRPLCDVWIDNGGPPADARRRADLLWSRLFEFTANQEARRPAARGGPVLVPYDPEWPAVAARLMARVRHAIGPSRIDHIGSTAVPGLAAKDVIDLQLTVADLAEADRFGPALADAGFPRFVGISDDTPHPDGPRAGDPVDAARIEADLGGWRKRLHVNADPGQGVNLHLRVRDWPNWVWSLRFRDWLRSDEAGRADYLEVKRAAESAHRADQRIDGYVQAKEEFLVEADLRSRAWSEAAGWTPG